MDREAAVIRSEMIQTRVELDRKISRLEERARGLTPRAYAQRHMPDFLLDRIIGGLLTLVGVKMAWTQLKRARNHRQHVRTAMVAYGRW
jgi:hypothetical protein